jgi:hypothetical protein
MDNITENLIKTNIFVNICNNKSKYWDGSLFAPFRQISSSRKKGAVGELMVAQLMTSLGHKVPYNSKGKPKKILPYNNVTDYDIEVDGYKVEVKTSSAWNETDYDFKFQQIRNQDYDRIIFQGLNNNNAKVWWATKGDLAKHIFGRDEYRQHGGKSGKQELYWIKTTDSIPSWFRDIDTF